MIISLYPCIDYNNDYNNNNSYWLFLSRRKNLQQLDTKFSLRMITNKNEIHILDAKTYSFFNLYLYNNHFLNCMQEQIFILYLVIINFFNDKQCRSNTNFLPLIFISRIAWTLRFTLFKSNTCPFSNFAPIYNKRYIFHDFKYSDTYLQNMYAHMHLYI